MSDSHQGRFRYGRFFPGLLAYALLIAYASTIVGPVGLHYVPLAPHVAWLEFLGRMSFWVDNGSDQRADWMGNLTMLMPFGFLLTATLAQRRSAGIVTFLIALALSVSFVLAVKFAQLYFPPRTVTLNYVVAQIGGATLGIAVFTASHGRLVLPAWRRAGGSHETLRRILILYAIGVFGFTLMPLDFALSAADLTARVDQVPNLLFMMPSAGRPLLVRTMVSIASAVAMVPFGVLMVLAPCGRNRLFAHAMLHGLAWLVAVFFLSGLLLSGSPMLVVLLVRIAGLMVGVRIMPWLMRRDPERLRRWLGTLALWALPPYLVVLIAVNALASSHWLGPDEAIANLYWRGLLPLFDYYIVSKAEAGKNIAAHIVMYAPLGLLAWARGFRPRTACWWGLLLALVVEGCRFFRPGLQGDFNAVAVAGASAWIAGRMMPGAWRLLESVTFPALVRPTVEGPDGAHVPPLPV